MEKLLPRRIFETKYGLTISGAITVLAVVKLASSLYSAFLKKRKDTDAWNRKGYTDIPSPLEKYPYFGHMFSLGDMPGLQFHKWHEAHGPILRLNMGVSHWVFINDPRLAHELLVKRGAVTSDRHSHPFAYDMYCANGSGVAFNKSRKKWKILRTIAMTKLSPQGVNRVTDDLEKSIDYTLGLMREEIQKHGAVYPLPYLELISFGFIIKSIFGIDVKSIDDPVLKKILHISRGVMNYSGTGGNLPVFLPHLSWITRLTNTNRKMKAIIDLRDSFVQRLLDEAVSRDTDCLVKHAHSLKEANDLNDTDIIVMSTDFIIGGGDTTSSLLLWLIAILAKYQDVQKKICLEIDMFITKHGRIPSFSDRSELPYTGAALRESIRFRCVSNFGVPHLATEDVEVGEYYIPKDTLIVTSMYAMHMNSDVYEDPHKFMPERFLGNTRTWSASSNGNIDKRDIYMFGWGRRICPGIYLSEVETFTVCVRFLASCSIVPPTGADGNPETIDLNTLVGSEIAFNPKEYKVMLNPRARYQDKTASQGTQADILV